jgi:hypothetical protein
MKRILMALFSLYAAALPCISQIRRCMAGLDMTGLLDNHVTAQLHYSYGHHWSVTGEASIPFSILVKSPSETEKGHHTAFTGTQEQKAGPLYHCERLFCSYWPTGAFNGISISAGVQTSSMKDIDCLARIGYMFRIWNNIHINTSVQIPLGSRKEHTIVSHVNLRISLNYKF